MARKQTKRQAAALKGWETRRARRKARNIKAMREMLPPAYMPDGLKFYAEADGARSALKGKDKFLKGLRHLVRGWFP